MRLLLALRKEAKTVLDVLHRQNLNETVTVKVQTLCKLKVSRFSFELNLIYFA